jgi:hypothetical protein
MTFLGMRMFASSLLWNSEWRLVIATIDIDFLITMGINIAVHNWGLII